MVVLAIVFVTFLGAGITFGLNLIYSRSVRRVRPPQASVAMASQSERRSQIPTMLAAVLAAVLTLGLALLVSEYALNPADRRWINHHAVALLPGALGLLGALVGEIATIRASLLKPGHLYPWQARTGTRPLGVGKYLVVVASDLLFGFLAGVVVHGENVGLNADSWKGALTLFFAGMSGPEILHRLGGTIRK